MFVLGVEHGYVYLEVGNAHVETALVAVLRQSRGYILAQPRAGFRYAVGRNRKRGFAFFCEIQKRFKPRNALAVGL